MESLCLLNYNVYMGIWGFLGGICKGRIPDRNERKREEQGMAWVLMLAIVVLAIVYVFYNYGRIRKMSEGTPEMAEMAGIIRSGASTFLKTEFRTVAIVVVLVAVVFSLFVEKASGITFILGALMSSTVCVLGMRSATYANVRTANKARESLSIGETVKVALCGGSISGLSVQAFGMLGLLLVLIIWGVDIHAESTGFLASMKCNPSIMRISTYSLGCSLVAMFNRVAGGNYTKAADISSDILAKLVSGRKIEMIHTSHTMITQIIRNIRQGIMRTVSDQDIVAALPVKDIVACSTDQRIGHAIINRPESTVRPVKQIRMFLDVFEQIGVCQVLDIDIQQTGHLSLQAFQIGVTEYDIVPGTTSNQVGTRCIRHRFWNHRTDIQR